MDARDDDPNDADAAGLPNRLLRKAETAIQGRTSRVLVVIERCTDEHNYSAVIRTAEALGVQHVWLIDPVDVDLDAVGSDDDDGGDEALRAADPANQQDGKYNPNWAPREPDCTEDFSDPELLDGKRVKL